jgi:GNAT superfamily N-acetyltransferase
VPEFAHAVADGDGSTLLGALYARLAEALVDQGVALHGVAHLSADAATTSALYQLGFGAVVTERLRGLSDVAVPSALHASHRASLERVESLAPHATLEPLAALAARHAAYYRRSPVFVIKDDSHASALAELEAHRAADDGLFVIADAGEPQAYLIVGPCAGVTEGRLLGGTATAQVRSAYTAPEARGRGFATALLQHAVRWARASGFERVLVEHESANLPAVAFWGRHFDAYLRVSMRSVDGRLVRA